jgi:hypothetical protein
MSTVFLRISFALGGIFFTSCMGLPMSTLWPERRCFSKGPKFQLKNIKGLKKYVEGLQK